MRLLWQWIAYGAFSLIECGYWQGPLISTLALKVTTHFKFVTLSKIVTKNRVTITQIWNRVLSSSYKSLTK